MHKTTIPLTQYRVTRVVLLSRKGTRKVTMLLIAAASLCLLGFLQGFGTLQCRSTGGRVVDAKDSSNQPDSKARCLLNCGFHRVDHNRMESDGAFKVSKVMNAWFTSTLVNILIKSRCFVHNALKKSKYVQLVLCRMLLQTFE